MNRIIKHSLSLLILLFLTPRFSFGQDSIAAIDSSWSILKKQLQRRSTVILNATELLERRDTLDVELIRNSRQKARDFIIFTDSLKIIDTLSLQSLHKKKQEVMKVISEIVAILLDDIELIKNSNERRNLQTQLESTENRITVATRIYNQICIENKRDDLIFDQKSK